MLHHRFSFALLIPDPDAQEPVILFPVQHVHQMGKVGGIRGAALQQGKDEVIHALILPVLTQLLALQQEDGNISQKTTIIIPAHNIPAFKPAKTFMNEVK